MSSDMAEKTPVGFCGPKNIVSVAYLVVSKNKIIILFLVVSYMGILVY